MSDLNSFREMASAMRTRTGFDATILTFKKGRWIAGQAGTDMNDHELIALVDDAMYGWVKWEDKKAVDYQVGFIRDKFKPPKRGQLGDTDPNKWDRRDTDPWQLTFFLPLADRETGQLYMYATSSRGGRDAIAALFDQYTENLERHPEDAGKMPVVALSRDHYAHQEYGRVETPQLDIIGWEEPPANIKPIKPPPPASPALIDHVAGAAALPDPKKGNGRGELDDEIPY